MNEYMQLALDLAAKWKGATSPNPVVGAVVVKDGKIVGQGAHEKAGEPHAEVHAMNAAGEAAKGSTLYVTLEPCSHYGKTPPCTEKIIASGVKKVVTAMVDPNPLVAGRGIARLRDAGIEVETGVGEAEAKKLNEIFIKYITTRKPFVILKAAISLDGKIAAVSGDSKWITNAAARHKVHELRHEVDAVLVGRGTFLSDNPRLDVRLPDKKRDPQKIVLSKGVNVEPGKLQQMAAYKLSTDKPLIIVGAAGVASSQKAEELQEMGVEVILLPDNGNGIDLPGLVTRLGEKGITSLLLEGGSGVYTSFLEAGLVDKVYLFLAPLIVGGDGIGWTQALGVKKIEEALRLKNVSYEVYADNLLTTGYLESR